MVHQPHERGAWPFWGTGTAPTSSQWTTPLQWPRSRPAPCGWRDRLSPRRRLAETVAPVVARPKLAEACRGGKLASPSWKHAAVCNLQAKFQVSERRACRVLVQPRGSQRYQAQARDDEEPLVKRMRELAGQRPRFGYRRIGALLRRELSRASPTRILRLWRREGLKVPQKRGKKRHQRRAMSVAPHIKIMCGAGTLCSIARFAAAS